MVGDNISRTKFRTPVDLWIAYIWFNYIYILKFLNIFRLQ